MVSSHIRHRLNCTKTLRKECKLHPTPSKLSKLSSSEANLRSELAYAKSNYETKLIQQFAYTNNSKIYRYISSLSTSSAGPPCVHLDAEAAISDQEKACLYNCSVFTSSGLTDPVTSIIPIQPSISSIAITTSDVYTALATLDPTKAMEIDGIGPRVLKFCALPLSQPLCHLFCLSLKHHDLPEEWRCHLVTPIFKSEDKSSVKNYRSISLLYSMSTVLERLVYNKIIGTIRDRLTNCQYGFLEGRSSLHQLIIFLNQINNALDNIGQVDALYLDLRKTFDSIPHNELLCNLWKIGICSDPWMWFKCYLSSHRQCVHINSSRSPFLPVLSGVSQGSILGPFLFLIYIDDLPTVVSSSSVLLFADDTKCFKTIHDQSDAQSL